MRLRTFTRALFRILVAVLTVFAVGAIEHQLPGWPLIGIATATLLALLAIAILRRGQTR